jgi:ABC-type transport system involved in multi-copper enzyme maturation permease subunit
MLAAARAELTKLLTLPRVWIVTGVILGFHTLVLFQPAKLFADAVDNITPDGTIEVFTGHPQPATEAIIGLLVASSLQVGLILPMLAAVIAGQEFRNHQLDLTMLAMPRRGRLLAAKVLVVAGYLLVVAILMAGMSTAFMFAAVKNWNPGLLVSADAFRGQGRFLAFAVLFSLTGYAITVLARSTLVSIIVTVFLIAMTATQVVAHFAPPLDPLLPLSAGRNLLLNDDLNRLTASPTHGLAVLAGWALVTTIVAGVALNRRDAR